MEIKDLKPNTGNVEIVAVIAEKEEPKTFEKFGKQGKVCNAKLKDDSGVVKLTLWNDDIEKVAVGDKVRVEKGWCSEFRDELQVSTGKFGQIEVVEKMEDSQVLTNDPKMLNPASASEDSGTDEDGSSSEEQVNVINEEEVIE
jgi:replication factor A1